MDHIADAVPVAKKHSSIAIGMVEVIGWLQSKGLKEDQGIGMNLGGSHKHADVTVSLTEARHSSGISDGDKTIYGGVPAGLIIAIDDGPTLYHAGDTTVFSDMKLIGELYHPDLAMLPIGDHYTMGPRLAAVAAKYVGAKTVLPIHWGTFPPLIGTPAALEKELAGSGITVIHTDPGKALS
jgi:L-ascorbate metabolism protein UlaG (beta-lactamase superfamily)